jgi:GNAT superfamily N-acetyltransferase
MRTSRKIERTPRPLEWRVALANGEDALVSSGPDVGWLPTFYEAYDRAFVLSDEKEDLEGFRQCLRLNAGASYDRLSHRYGHFVELVVLVRERATGRPMGGANFAAFVSPDEDAVTVNLNYIFVDAAFRRRGLFRALVDLVVDQARAAFVFGERPPEAVTLFIEVNDPIRMTPEDYRTDSQHTGLDQFDRINIWAGLGARLIDFDYGQPALSPDQASEDGLLYCALGALDAGLSACRLKAHLERFFAISVMKGRDPMEDGQAARQISDLNARCSRGENIALLELTPIEDARTAQGARSASSYLEIARRRTR